MHSSCPHNVEDADVCYKALCIVLHPDKPRGDNESFTRLTTLNSDRLSVLKEKEALKARLASAEASLARKSWNEKMLLTRLACAEAGLARTTWDNQHKAMVHNEALRVQEAKYANLYYHLAYSKGSREPTQEPTPTPSRKEVDFIQSKHREGDELAAMRNEEHRQREGQLLTRAEELDARCSAFSKRKLEQDKLAEEWRQELIRKEDLLQATAEQTPKRRRLAFGALKSSQKYRAMLIADYDNVERAVKELKLQEAVLGEEIRCLLSEHDLLKLSVRALWEQKATQESDAARDFPLASFFTGP